MKRWIMVAGITLVVAAAALATGPILFPLPSDGPQPTAAQIPLFIFLGITDAVLLGLGISFLIFGLPILKQVSPDSKARAWAMYLSIGYLMVSWWPHLGLHSSLGMNLSGLLVVDFVFHLPLEVAGVILAGCFLSLIRGRAITTSKAAA